MTDLLTPAQFAKRIGNKRVTDRHVRRLCADGMAGAKRVGRGWMIDHDKAMAWLSKSSNVQRISMRLPITIPKRKVQKAKASPPASKPTVAAGVASVLGDSIADLKVVADALLSVLTEGSFDPRAAQMLKQTLSEIRHAETHVLAMRQADGQMMLRSRHRLICSTIATQFATNVKALPPRLSEQIIDALTEAGVKVRDPGKAIRVVTTRTEHVLLTFLDACADEAQRTDYELIADRG